MSTIVLAVGLGKEALYYIEKSNRFTSFSSSTNEMVQGYCYYAPIDYPKSIAAHELAFRNGGRSALEV